MRDHPGRTLTIARLVPLAVIAISLSTPSFAQFGGAGAGGGGNGISNPASPMNAGKHGLGPGDTKTVTAPPVLPGTKAPSVAAEPTQSASSMSPTEALFDAINRGDKAGAQDAVNRGASLDAVNVLGLTPLDLSVDLGRNDITFLLLSLRGDEGSVRRPASGAGVSASAAITRRDLPEPAAVAPRRARVLATAGDDDGVQVPTGQAPRLFSGNGGAPIPSAGFLGFDNGRAVR